MRLIKLAFNMIWLMVNQKNEPDNVLRDKAFKITSDPKYDGYQRGLTSMIYKLFDKKSSGSGAATEPNYQLANEFHRQIIKKFKRAKVYSSFKDNIWGVDLADMQSLSKCNKGINIYFVQLICLVNMHGLFL